MHRILLAALAFTLVSPAVRAQGTTSNAFTWDGAITQGSWLRIRNLNGDITVEGTSGNTAHVRAEKSWRRGDPGDVHFTVVKDGSNVTICALWHEDDSCDAQGSHSHGHSGDRHNDVSVHFTVQLPAGVKVDAGTVNGSLDIGGAQAEVAARTVNGQIRAASATGPVNASTVNGGIHVRMDALAGDGDLRFTTVNGSVHVQLPATVNAELDMSTVNGSLESDYPLTVRGHLNPRHIHATLGTGGRHLRLETVNGSVALVKR